MSESKETVSRTAETDGQPDEIAVTVFEQGTEFDPKEQATIGRQVSIVEPPTASLSCTRRATRCCRYRLAERDWTGSFFRLKELFWVVAVFGAGLAVDYRDYEKRLWGEEYETWIYVLAAALGAIWAGRVIDRVIFIVIDLIFFSRFTIVLLYYLNATEGYLGLILTTGAFEAYYPEVLGHHHDNVDRSVAFFSYLLFGRILNRMVIKIVLRKTLFSRFVEKIDEVLVYKNFVYRLSTMVQEPIAELFPQEEHDVNWKMMAARSKGFEVSTIEGIRAIHRRVRMQEFIHLVWQRLTTRLKTNGPAIETDAILRWAGVAAEDPSAPMIRQMIDPNRDTLTIPDEFRYGLLEMFTSWKQIRSSLDSQTHLSKGLSILNGIIFWLIAVYIFFKLFDISFGGLFNPLLALLVSLSFVFGPTLSDLASGVWLISILQPYHVGDKIRVEKMADDKSLIVRQITIWSTEVHEVGSGVVISLPNAKLVKKAIYNYHRSKDVTFTLDFEIGSDASFDQLAELERRIGDYLHQRPFVWKPQVDMYPIGSTNLAAGKRKVSYWVMHQASWTQGRIWADKRLLVEFIVEQMRELEIEYHEFSLPVVLKSHDA